MSCAAFRPEVDEAGVLVAKAVSNVEGLSA